jgi:hypothetical protein
VTYPKSRAAIGAAVVLAMLGVAIALLAVWRFELVGATDSRSLCSKDALADLSGAVAAFSSRVPELEFGPVQSDECDSAGIPYVNWSHDSIDRFRSQLRNAGCNVSEPLGGRRGEAIAECPYLDRKAVFFLADLYSDGNASGGMNFVG